MTTQFFPIKFAGFWAESNKNCIPAESGIYNVYIGKRSLLGGRRSLLEGKPSLEAYIYTGESENIRDRISNHEKKLEWSKHLKNEQVLYYTVAKVDALVRKRCEAAIIYHHKPKENIEYVNDFPFEKTTIKLSGETRFLVQEKFTVSNE